MPVSILNVLEKMIHIFENNYAGYEYLNPNISQPFLSLASFLEASQQLDDGLLQDIAELYLNAQHAKGVSFAFTEDIGKPELNVGFSVRGEGDSLWVTHVFHHDRVKEGDCVLTIGGKSPSTFRSQVLQMNRVVPFTAEDEWRAVLNHAKFMTVRHMDGSMEKIILKTGHYPDSPTYTAELSADGKLLYLRADKMDDSPEYRAWEAKTFRLANAAKSVILDLRCQQGGDPVLFQPFYRFAVDRQMEYRELSTPYKMYGYYSDTNCDALTDNLNIAAKISEEYRVFAEQYKTDLLKLRGVGWTEETEQEEDNFVIEPISNINKTWILTDRCCSSEVELFLKNVKGMGKVCLIGRATSGDYHYANEVQVKIGFSSWLTYPVSVSEESRKTGKCQGIAPDILIPWTPEECTQDILLQETMKRADI